MARLTPELVDFLDSGLAHQLGACDRAGAPYIARALGALVEADGRLSVLLSCAANPALLDAVRETGRASVVLCQTRTLRTIQVKGADAEVAIAESPAYRDALARREAAFWRAVEPLGFSSRQLPGWYAVPEGELARITFTPNGAWNQTPGPGAGAPIELMP